jgi:hypothetical protein
MSPLIKCTPISHVITCNSNYVLRKKILGSSHFLNLRALIRNFKSRACGQRSLNVILESSRSLRAYIKESNFNISWCNRQRYWHDIFRNIYRVLQAIRAQYMQYIRYDPWVKPTPLEREIAEYLPTPKKYNILPCFMENLIICHTGWSCPPPPFLQQELH